MPSKFGFESPKEALNRALGEHRDLKSKVDQFLPAILVDFAAAVKQLDKNKFTVKTEGSSLVTMEFPITRWKLDHQETRYIGISGELCWSPRDPVHRLTVEWNSKIFVSEANQETLSSLLKSECRNRNCDVDVVVKSYFLD